MTASCRPSSSGPGCASAPSDSPASRQKRSSPTTSAASHEQSDQAEAPRHHAVRHHGVEVAALDRGEERRAAEDQERGEQHADQRRGQHHRGLEAVAAIRARERRGPGVLLVRRGADLRQRARNVDPELVRRRVLAGVEALAAVVAQVGEVVHVAGGEVEAPLHGREDRAVALAIAAGIADGHLPRALAHQFNGLLHVPPPCPRCVRTPCRWSCRSRRDSPCRECCRP